MLMLTGNPPMAAQSILSSGFSISGSRPSKPLSPSRKQIRSMSAFEARLSLVLALASQSASLSQRLVADLLTETAKYAFPQRFESRNLEEALMSAPDLETFNFKVLSRNDHYEIREVEPYFIAETTMPGKTGFDFNGASQSFNVLAEYLFGKNISKEKMEMTTPVITRKTTSVGKRMEMTTPVITRKSVDQEKWEMSFVMPSKYGGELPMPINSSVRITEVPKKIVAVAAFSGILPLYDDTSTILLSRFQGFVTDEEVGRRENMLRRAVKKDREFQIKAGAEVEVAQYNPPFTLPFTRRNEIAIEVERKHEL